MSRITLLNLWIPPFSWRKRVSCSRRTLIRHSQWFSRSIGCLWCSWNSSVDHGILGRMSEYTSYPKLNISIDKTVMQRIINKVRDVCLLKKTGAELDHKPRVLRKRELRDHCSAFTTVQQWVPMVCYIYCYTRARISMAPSKEPV